MRSIASEAAAPSVRVRLLGAFELRASDGGPVRLDSARSESLLAYLVLHRDAPQPRERLAYLLWPDSAEPQARTNLRHLLHKLRRAGADRFVEITARTLRWRPDPAAWIDVAEFERLLDEGSVRAAVDVYGGDLLSGRYDDWILPDRERLRARYLDALERLSAQHHADGELVAAADVAERLLHEDPLREATYRLLMSVYDARGERARAVSAYHRCASTLEQELGVAPSPETQAAYAALLPTASSTPQPRRGRPTGPPLVGRAAERNLLTDAWRATESGLAQLILLTGEAGIGKTRLAEEFAGWCSRRGAAIATARAHAGEGALAYAPVVAWLRSPALRPLLSRLTPPHLREIARLLPELTTEVPGLAEPEPLPEDEQRQRLFDAVAHAVRAASLLVVVADDLHRFDRESLRLLHYLLRADPDARLLVVATARPEDLDHDHHAHAILRDLRVMERVTEIELTPLTPAQTAALASHLIGRTPSEHEAQRLYRESEGNPLFLVEFLRAGLPSEGSVSPKVQAVIEAWLARLSPAAREMAGVAAAIGREFSADVLIAAAGTDEDTVVEVLDELWTRRILREQGDHAYDFAHDKIREVAYSRLGPARRRRAHRRIAEVLQQAADPDAVSGEIALHYERAGATGEAVRWHAWAADAATRLQANVEALDRLTHALALVRTLPTSGEREGMELDLLTALPAVLGAVEGWSGPRLSAAQARALELTGRLGVEPEPPLTRSLALTSLTRSDFDRATRFGDQLKARGEREDDAVLIVEGAYVLGIAAFWQARFETAREHFELAARRYRPEHRGVHLLRYAQDTHVVCVSRLANTLWFLGEADEAARRRDAALALAREGGHPFSLGVALVFAALLAVDMADEPHLRRFSSELEALDGRARPITDAAQALNGYVAVLDGRVAEGLAACRRAVDDARRSESAPGAYAVHERVLLAACLAASDVPGALAAAERLLASDGAARVWWAEARRRRDELLARNDHGRG